MGPMEGAGERLVEHGMRGLDLQPAQREQLQTLAQAARADMQPLRQEGRALREERLGGGSCFVLRLPLR